MFKLALVLVLILLAGCSASPTKAVRETAVPVIAEVKAFHDASFELVEVSAKGVPLRLWLDMIQTDVDKAIGLLMFVGGKNALEILMRGLIDSGRLVPNGVGLPKQPALDFYLR